VAGLDKTDANAGTRSMRNDSGYLDVALGKRKGDIDWMPGTQTQRRDLDKQAARPDVPGLEVAYSLSTGEEIDIELDGIASITSQVSFHFAILRYLFVSPLALKKIDDRSLLRHRGFPSRFYGFFRTALLKLPEECSRNAGVADYLSHMGFRDSAVRRGASTGSLGG
jgi:hypothetical protein